jgi:hypothetical protein
MVSPITIDRSILDYLKCKGYRLSRNGRVNELLWRAILEAHYEALEREAAGLYAPASKTEHSEYKPLRRIKRRSRGKMNDGSHSA